MIREICIVPTFEREELLYLTLEAIRKADQEIAVKVFSDRGACSRDLLFVCKWLGAELVHRATHNFFGNSYNLLKAMESVLVLDAPDIVHLVENDTIIHPRYFDWARMQLCHESEQNLGGGQLQRWKTFASAYAHMSGDLARSEWYESPCASWSAVTLQQSLSMIPCGYFAKTKEEMQAAIDAQFPRSKYRGYTPEQDGFFLRCIEHFAWKTVHPARPLASHIGWYGYNRPKIQTAPEGRLEKRIAFARKVFDNVDARSVHFGRRITELEVEGMQQ